MEQEDHRYVRLKSRRSRLHNPSRPDCPGKVEVSWSSLTPGISQVSSGLVREKKGRGEPGMVFWLQAMRSAPRPSSQTLSIAGSLARLINELFRLTLDLWSKSRALCGTY